MKICGIYLIECETTKFLYVGSSVDVNVRLAKHRWELERGTHSNRNLQFAWAKQKGKGFTFRLVEKCVYQKLAERECSWMKNNSHKLFNIAAGGGGRPSWELYKEKQRRKNEVHGVPEEPLPYLEYYLELGATYVAKILGVAYPTYAAYRSGSRELPQYHLNQVILLLMLEEKPLAEYVEDRLNAST